MNIPTLTPTHFSTCALTDNTDPRWPLRDSLTFETWAFADGTWRAGQGRNTVSSYTETWIGDDGALYVRSDIWPADVCTRYSFEIAAALARAAAWYVANDEAYQASDRWDAATVKALAEGILADDAAAKRLADDADL